MQELAAELAARFSIWNLERCFLLHGTRVAASLRAGSLEGAEWEVLRSFPFDEITVAVWSIESNRHNRTELHEYMEGKGYSCTDPDHINTVCHLTKEDSE